MASSSCGQHYVAKHGGDGGGGLAFLPAFSDLQSSQKCLDDRFASGCDFAQAQHQRLRCPFKFSPQLAAFNLLVEISRLSHDHAREEFASCSCRNHQHEQQRQGAMVCVDTGNPRTPAG